MRPEACNEGHGRRRRGAHRSGAWPTGESGATATRTPKSTARPRRPPTRHQTDRVRRPGAEEPGDPARQPGRRETLRPKVPPGPLFRPCRTFAIATSLEGSRKETVMTTRSNFPIVLGVDQGTLEGRTLRWAAEQAHLEGRRLKLVTASGAVSAAQWDYGMGPLSGQLGGTQPSGRGGPGQGSGGATSHRAIRRCRPDVPGGGSEHAAHPALQLRSSRDCRIAGEGYRPQSPARLRRSCRGSTRRVSGGRAPPRLPGTGAPRHRRRRRGHGGLHAGTVLRLPPSEPSAPATQGRPLRVRRPVGTGRHPHGRRPRRQPPSSTSACLPSRWPASAKTSRMCTSASRRPGGRLRKGLASLSKHADLTVVGRHQRGLVGRLLAGSVSGSVVQHGHGPIAIVPVT